MIRAILCGILQEKGRRPEFSRTFCASLRSRNAHRYHKSHFTREFSGKMPRPRSATPVLCQPVQSHMSHFLRKFTGTGPQAKSKQNLRRRLRASLRSRNAHGHLTRAIVLMRKVTGKMLHPRVSTLITLTLTPTVRGISISEPCPMFFSNQPRMCRTKVDSPKSQSSNSTTTTVTTSPWGHAAPQGQIRNFGRIF